MKKQLVLLILAFLVIDLSAQCERQWSTELSQQCNAEIYSISPAKNGYQIFGTFIDSITVDSVVYVSNGGKDVFLAIADSLGKLQKTVCFGGGGDEIPAMVMASDSLLTIGGLTTWCDENHTGSIFVRTYDNGLKEKLDIDIPYTGKMRLDMVNVTADAILIGGSLKGTIKTEGFCINNYDNEHAFVIRYSNDGKYIDSWYSEGTGRHRLHSIDVCGEKTSVLLSVAEGTFVADALPATVFSGQGVQILSLDGNLSPKWASTAKCNGYVEASKISHTSNGTLACMNFSGMLETPDSTYSSLGSMSSLMTCFGHDGSVLWANVLDGGYCRVVDMACSDSMVACTGYFRDVLSVGGDTICQSSVRKAFLLCFDRNGSLSWNVSMDSNGASTGRSVIVEGDEVVLCSSSRRTDSRSSEGITLASDLKTNNDISKYRLNIDEESIEDDSSDEVGFSFYNEHESVKSDSVSFVSVTVFPNPTKQNVHWIADGLKVSTIEVYDVRGLLAIRRNTGGQTSGKVDLSNLASGAYVLRFISEDEIHSLEIIKN